VSGGLSTIIAVSFFFGAPGRGLDMYHVGLTVPDVRAAMESYSDAFGFTWASVHESRMSIVVDGVDRDAEIAVTYSVQGPPYLELVQERRGSVWGADGFALTHVGFWAEDIAAAKRGLEASGLPARVHAQESEGRPMRYSYHEFGGGLWIELVHTSFQAELSSWIAETLEEGR
jgi:hypothetical protein